MKKASKPAVTETPLPPQEILDHHRRTYQPLLDQWAATGKITPVLLLSGLPGIGKRGVAVALASWILCEQSPAKTGNTQAGTHACGTCRSCHAVQEFRHVDFREIAPEASESGRAGQLKIEQIREIRETQGFGGYEGNYRIFLISNADTLTVAAANALLKVLEEPPPGWIFFLSTPDAARVLPTLSSRCQKLRLRPVPTTVLAQALEKSGVPVERVHSSAHLASGSWGQALHLSQDSAWKQRALLLNFAADPAGDFEKLVEWGSQDVSQLQFIIDQLEQICNSSLEMSYQSKPETQDLEPYFKKTIQQKGSIEKAREFWLQCAETLEDARHKLPLPLNRKLLAQQVLFPWLPGAQADP